MPRPLRLALAIGVLGSAALGVVLAVYSTLGSPWHLLFVAGTAGGGFAYFAVPWRWPAAKLGTAGVVATTGAFVTWVLASAVALVCGGKALGLLAAGVPFWVVAALAPGASARTTRAAALLAGVLAVEVSTLALGPVVVFRFIYSYDAADLAAQRERVAAEPGVEILVDATTTGRTDPRSIVVVGDQILAAFSNSSGAGQGACTLLWPDDRCLHPGLESLSFDEALGRACAVGTRPEGVLEGHLFCARLDGGGLEGVDLPDRLGLAGAFDAGRRRFYVVDEQGGFTVLGADPLAVLSHRSLTLYHPDAAAALWAADRLIARSSDGFVASVDLADLSFTRRFLDPLAVGMGIGVSESRREVYVADMMRPVVRVLDPTTLAEKRRLRVARGLRPIADLGDTGWIACGGFYDGILYVVEPLTGAVVAQRYVGKLVRALAYDASHRAVLVGSSAGLLRVSLPPPPPLRAPPS